MPAGGWPWRTTAWLLVVTNHKIYIHEFIDVIGHNRARYMQHMTANWVPVAIEERNQYCFGVWGTVGSTGRWPEVVNVWELEGWEGLAANFDHELSHASLQDPSLAEWWSQAATLRRGGVDRILIPAPWSPTSAELLAAGVRGRVYVHELFSLTPGTAPVLLDHLASEAQQVVASLGLALVGAFRVAMCGDQEAVVIWAVPDWSSWISYERAWDPGGALGGWAERLRSVGAKFTRTLMMDAPLCPLRTGRQPRVEDRRPLSEF